MTSAVTPAVTLPPVLSVTRRLADELGVTERRVAAAVDLLDSGSTVPFIARYRKEATDSLDDAQLRTLSERLGYLRELDERRTAVAEAIAAQNKLTPELAAALAAAETKARLEDIYLPYRAKRRTKAQIAREAGLQPLADALLAEPHRDPARTAAGYIDPNRGLPETSDALAGARAILVERFAEDADLVGRLRDRLWARGRLVAGKRPEVNADDPASANYRDYYDFAEPLTRLPSHRVLAMLRGEKDGVLQLTVSPEPEDADPTGPSGYERAIAAHFGIADRGRAADDWLLDTVRWAWRTKLAVSLAVDVRMRLRQQAEQAAAGVFAANLRDVLLAAPAGSRPTLGLDPGFRTGVKVAVVDGTGKVVATDTIYPHQPHNRWDRALASLAELVDRHRVELIAIGNGTASRETDKLAAELIATLPAPRPVKIVVSEAGASVYSASAYASRELPGLDVSLRGAVSIARRLQDPLAELVKIDPRSIGVGQYQHDIADSLLSRTLDNVVEDCVNAVGVDVNTASVPLLARVSGVTATLAENIVKHRDANGPFASRGELKKVPRLGAKAFEQCAGFLRIRGGRDPLDRSGVHPEAYPLVKVILQRTAASLDAVIGNAGLLRALNPADYVDDTFGVPTITDILAELEKPGRDPRPGFTTASFAEGVQKIADLRPGMVLEGVVTNVAAFGAFVDIGVHQDGLVHVSAMSEKFVSDPRQIVRSGQVVRVKVMEVDPSRKRIALSLRLADEPGAPKATGRRGPGGAARENRSEGRDAGPRGRIGAAQDRGGQRPEAAVPSDGSLADALRRAGFGRP